MYKLSKTGGGVRDYMHIMTLSYYICTQVEIPNTDTTYWCAAAELPQEVQQRQQYVVRVSSRITIVELWLPQVQLYTSVN